MVDVHPVTGTITFNGGPVANATVSFAPKDGQPVATGKTDGKGKYTLSTYEFEDGAAAGNFVVLVSKSMAAPTQSGGGEHNPANPYGNAAMHSAQAERKGGVGLPEKYSKTDTSDLSAKVPADDPKAYDFDLKG